MEIKEIGFTGKKYLETSLEDHKDKWVLFSLRGNGSFVGKLIEINDKEASFLPYQKPIYDENGMATSVIIEDGLPNSHIRMEIIGYKPSSEEEALNFCKNMDKKYLIEFLKEKKEIFELEKVSKEIDNMQNKIILDYRK